MDLRAIDLEPPTSGDAEHYGQLLVAGFKRQRDGQEPPDELLDEMDGLFARLSSNDRYFFNRASADLYQIEGEEHLRALDEKTRDVAIRRIDAIHDRVVETDWIYLLEVLRHRLAMSDINRAWIRSVCYAALGQPVLAEPFLDFIPDPDRTGAYSIVASLISDQLRDEIGLRIRDSVRRGLGGRPRLTSKPRSFPDVSASRKVQTRVDLKRVVGLGVTRARSADRLPDLARPRGRGTRAYSA